MPSTPSLPKPCFLFKFKWLRPCRRPLEFNYKFGSKSGGGRRGGCASPHPPAFPGGSVPRTPQKALRALGCSCCSLSHDRATCPGRTFLRNPTFLEEATCPRQLRCLGQNFFSEVRLFVSKPLVRGSFAAWGRTVSQKSDFSLNKPLVPGTFAAWGRTFGMFVFF